MKIYLVIGESGEIDDYNNWTICAYIDKEKAIEHALNAKSRVDTIQRMNNNPRIKDFDRINQYDYHTNDYNSIYECFYSVQEVELND